MTVDELIPAVREAFQFLLDEGWSLRKVNTCSPESFKGGFELRYESPESEVCVVQYGDMELTIRRGEEEVFGAQRHPAFAGNQFSRENLVRCAGRIAEAVRPDLTR